MLNINLDSVAGANGLVAFFSEHAVHDFQKRVLEYLS